MIQDKTEEVSVLDDAIGESIYYKTFFNKSANYYEERYNRFINGGEKFIFNPYAFFLGFFWLSYRKMYIEMIVLFLILIVIECTLFLGFDIDSTSFENLLKILCALTIGGSANYFYFKRAKRTVDQAKEMYANMGDQLDYIERKGGTSYISPIIFGVLLFILIIGLIALDEYIGTPYY